jgi:hypothetical protein
MMTRRCYVQIDGVLYERGTEPRAVRDRADAVQRQGPTVLPDLPDFISPIDGKSYSGRTGLRDHCARHDVVPTADLSGLPLHVPVKQPSKNEIKEKILEYVHRTGVFREQL